MNLVRLAILSFNPPLEKKWQNAVFDNQRVKIKTYPITIDKQPNNDWIICEAEIVLQDFPILKDNKIQIPEELRKELEGRIENVANILSVSAMSQRSISSPMPCIGFRVKNQEELVTETYPFHVEPTENSTNEPTVDRDKNSGDVL